MNNTVITKTALKIKSDEQLKIVASLGEIASNDCTFVLVINTVNVLL